MSLKELKRYTDKLIKDIVLPDYFTLIYGKIIGNRIEYRFEGFISDNQWMNFSIKFKAEFPLFETMTVHVPKDYYRHRRKKVPLSHIAVYHKYINMLDHLRELCYLYVKLYEKGMSYEQYSRSIKKSRG